MGGAAILAVVIYPCGYSHVSRYQLCAFLCSVSAVPILVQVSFLYQVGP
jgi:hypothetical protein